MPTLAHSVFLDQTLISSSTINYTETLTEEITDMFEQDMIFIYLSLVAKTIVLIISVIWKTRTRTCGHGKRGH